MQINIQNVLYSTELSQNSHITFRYAMHFAKITGADVHLLHVLGKLSDDARLALPAYIQDDNQRHEVIDERVKKARDRWEQRQEAFWAEQTAEDRKVHDQIESVTACESYPAEKFLNSVETYNCDPIVMDSRERGMSHAFLGSVAKSVLRRSHESTRIVPLVEAH